MIELKGGTYYTLADIALRLGISRQAVHQRAVKIGATPTRFGRLFTRYHESAVKLIFASYGKLFGKTAY
jgi:Zn-dependent peptidase ImmA (M78 family)